MQDYQTFEFEEGQLKEILNKDYIRHEKEIGNLENVHESNFRTWMFYLKEGFSLLMYGVGSKIKLIEKFTSTKLPDSYVLTVKGFHSKLLLRDVVRSLVVDVFGEARCPLNLDEAIFALKKLLKQSKFPVFVIVYNIDGLSLRSPKRQMVMSKLASLPHLHLIATVDCINAPLLWGEKVLSQFNFMWLNITTYEPYLYETWNKEILKMPSSSNDDIFNVFMKIYNGSSDKLKKLVKLIVKDCFENSHHEHQGIKLQDLYARAIEEMLLGQEHLKSLNNLLKDFYDHGVMKRSADNSIILNIDAHALSIFYESECEKEN